MNDTNRNLSPKTQDDRVAQTIIGKALGVDVRVHDDNSRDKMYDLKFEYSNGRTAAAEIVSNRDGRLRSTWDQCTKIGYTNTSALKRAWTVTVNHGTRLTKDNRKGIISLLSRLEMNDIQQTENVTDQAVGVAA